MDIAGIIGGVATIVVGICIIIFPSLLAWIVGISFMVTGLVYAIKSVKK